jgi:hypothetical protein
MIAIVGATIEYRNKTRSDGRLTFFCFGMQTDANLLGACSAFYFCICPCAIMAWSSRSKCHMGSFIIGRDKEDSLHVAGNKRPLVPQVRTWGVLRLSLLSVAVARDTSVPRHFRCSADLHVPLYSAGSQSISSEVFVRGQLGGALIYRSVATGLVENNSRIKQYIVPCAINWCACVWNTPL